MIPKSKITLFISLIAAFLMYSAFSQATENLNITDIKTASVLSEKLVPVNTTDTFPKGTSKVYCWFSWKDAGDNTQVTAKWHYTTKQIKIIDHSFLLPQKEGSGSVLLNMPDKKPLPSGSYTVDLMTGGHIIKSLKFKIE